MNNLVTACNDCNVEKGDMLGRSYKRKRYRRAGFLARLAKDFGFTDTV